MKRNISTQSPSEVRFPLDDMIKYIIRGKNDNYDAKEFIIWPIEGKAFRDGRELGLFVSACTLDTTLEETCRELGCPVEYVDSYIETEAMPKDAAIAYCKMMEFEYATTC